MDRTLDESLALDDERDRRTIVYWQLKGGRTLTSIVGPPALIKEALSRDHDKTFPNKRVIRPWIPPGAQAWSFSDRGPWKPITELPAYLNLQRPQQYVESEEELPV